MQGRQGIDYYAIAPRLLNKLLLSPFHSWCCVCMEKAKRAARWWTQICSECCVSIGLSCQWVRYSFKQGYGGHGRESIIPAEMKLCPGYPINNPFTCSKL